MSPGIRCFWDPSVREAAGPARRPAVSPVSLTADRPFFPKFSAAGRNIPSPPAVYQAGRQKRRPKHTPQMEGWMIVMKKRIAALMSLTMACAMLTPAIAAGTVSPRADLRAAGSDLSGSGGSRWPLHPRDQRKGRVRGRRHYGAPAGPTRSRWALPLPGTAMEPLPLTAERCIRPYHRGGFLPGHHQHRGSCRSPRRPCVWARLPTWWTVPLTALWKCLMCFWATAPSIWRTERS